MQPRFGETPPEPRDPKRFLLDVALAQAGDPGKVLIHDTVTMTAECDQVANKDASRFGDFEWALAKGYQPCPKCMGNTATLPQAAPKLDPGAH